MIESPLVKFFLGEGKQSARRQIRYSRHQRRSRLQSGPHMHVKLYPRLELVKRCLPVVIEVGVRKVIRAPFADGSRDHLLGLVVRQARQVPRMRVVDSLGTALHMRRASLLHIQPVALLCRKRHSTCNTQPQHCESNLHSASGIFVAQISLITADDALLNLK